MIVLGLTGSIGMGKSTCAKMLQDLGIPVHDSDASVHTLLAAGGAGEDIVLDAFPSLSRPINRKKLGNLVFGDSKKLEKLEAILHPLVQEGRNIFVRKHRKTNQKMVAMDIPLLFETGLDVEMDYCIVASAPAHIQHTRVLKRPGMTEEKFKVILARQIPDDEKCKRADFIVQTGLDHAHAMKQIKEIIEQVRKL